MLMGNGLPLNAVKFVPSNFQVEKYNAPLKMTMPLLPPG